MRTCSHSFWIALSDQSNSMRSDPPAPPPGRRRISAGAGAVVHAAGSAELPARKTKSPAERVHVHDEALRPRAARGRAIRQCERAIGGVGAAKRRRRADALEDSAILVGYQLEPRQRALKVDEVSHLQAPLGAKLLLPLL